MPPRSPEQSHIEYEEPTSLEQDFQRFLDSKLTLNDLLEDHQSEQSEVVSKLIDAGKVEILLKPLANDLEYLLFSLDNETVIKLIDNGGAELIWNAYKDFSEFTIPAGEKLIQEGKVELLVKPIKGFASFNWSDYPKLGDTFAQALLSNGFEKDLANSLGAFRNLSTEIAEELIDKGFVDEVAMNLSYFTHLSNSVAEKIYTDSGGIKSVIDNLEDFPDLDHNVVANKAIELGRVDLFKSTILLSKFKNLNFSIAEKIIESFEGFPTVLAKDFFSSFKREDYLKIAEVLIDYNFSDQLLINCLNLFNASESINIVEILVDHKQLSVLVENQRLFHNLPDYLALKILEQDPDYLIAMLGCFYNLPEHIAQELIKSGFGNDVLIFFNNFHELDFMEISKQLIEDKDWNAVAANIQMFVNYDNEEIAELMIKDGETELFLQNAEKFFKIDKDKIINQIIFLGKGALFLKYKSKFLHLDEKSIAKQFMKTGHEQTFVENLDKFTKLDWEIAEQLVLKYKGYNVVHNLGSFVELDLAKLIDLLIEKNQAMEVCHNLADYVDQQEGSVITKIIQSGQSHALALNINRWTKVDKMKVVQEILDHGDYKAVAVNLRNFENLPASIAKFFVENRMVTEVAGNLDSFKTLTADIAHKLLSEGHFDAVMHNRFRFEGLEINPEEYTTYAHYITNGEWTDHHNVIKPYDRGASIFGDKLMLEYLANPDLTRHDGLHAFDKIIEVYKASGLKPKTFYGNILKQVALDSGEYDEGLAQHYLNSIAESINLDFDHVLKEASRYDIPELNELAEHYNNKDKIFASWIDLKKYVKLTEILEKVELLQELEALNKTGPKELYNYVAKLGFHRTSKVDMQAVMDFWKHPNKFLNANDNHTSTEIQNRKKPSNYTEIPHLDLNAKELVAAFVEGSYDKLQVFNPMEIRYKVTIGNRTETLIAKINKKSDPDAALAGNDTSCCMPFGSGKNNVYMFNPNTALFTLQIEKADGNTRTIAQSVLTKDKDVGVEVPVIVEQMTRSESHLSDIVKEENVLSSSLSFLACDNVETAANYQSNGYPEVIEALYKDFFEEYMSKYGVDQGLDVKKVLIGMGYSDALTAMPKETNTYIPLAPMGYSDKLGKEVYVINLGEDTQIENGIEEREITEYGAEIPPRQKDSEKNVRPLTFEDTLSVALLEGKAYADNQSLIVYLHNIENGLIAKDVNNASKGRPNLCLKYVNDQGQVRGYLLAYEGDLDSGERGIYISDLAVDPKAKIAGGHIVNAFTELYQREYLEKGNPLPIFAEAREQTSFKLITRKLEKIGETLGYKFKIEEGSTYQRGNDTMHPVTITPE